MCGRYLLRNAPEGSTHSTWDQYWHDVNFQLPRYNIAPGQHGVVIRYLGKEIRCELLKWGYRPSWSKYNPAINAKAETLLESKMFKGSARHKRCLVVADGFYEPKGPSGEKNRPWYCFQYEDLHVFAIAGIWTDEGFSIITSAPNQVVGPIHDRMPLILEPSRWQSWLSAEVQDDVEISHLLTPSEYPGMQCHRVSDFVKNPNHEGPGCIEPAANDAEIEKATIKHSTIDLFDNN